MNQQTIHVPCRTLLGQTLDHINSNEEIRIVNISNVNAIERLGMSDHGQCISNRCQYRPPPHAVLKKHKVE